MAKRIFEAALGNRLLTILAVLVLTGLGLRAMTKLPIDAVPDVTPNVVQVVTDASGLGPAEVEKFITFPVEIAMRGMPGITEIRSQSRFGLSSVWVYFEEKYDIYFARRLVMERLPAARDLIPKGYGSPEMTPVSTALGEIYQFEVVDPKLTLMQLRSILDWQIVPRLKAVPGVVEVNSFGGEMKTFEVQLDPEALVKYGIGLDNLFRALERNNASTGGGYIVHSGEQEVIRGTGLIGNLNDVANVVVGNHSGVPIYVRNLGKVAFAPRIRQGAVTHDGQGETVVGVVMMLIGENSRVVVDRVKAKIAEIQPTLPQGVKIVPFYDRADLIRRTINAVTHNLIEGAVLVIVVLYLFLGDLRASLIVGSVIPLSMLVAFMGMTWAGVSGNPMSLGAIDFGLIVDGSVVMIENIFRRLSQGDAHGASVSHRIFDAGREVLRPIVFAIGIIIIVYLPILTFENVEGENVPANGTDRDLCPGRVASDDAKLILKVSYNIGADTSLLLYGLTQGVNNMGDALVVERHNLISNYAIRNGQFEFIDGSGGGLTTATNPAVTKMLLELAARPAFPYFFAALPILGVDGSLAFVTDFQSDPTLAGARGQVNAKTGTFVAGSASGLMLKAQAFAGYIKAKSGRRLVYELVVNDVPITGLKDVIQVFQDEGTISAILWRDY